MGLSEKEQIEKLKEVALGTLIPDVKKKVIDVLAIYGEEAIPAIAEIIERTISRDVKEYGLKVIEQIKKGSELI